MDNSVIALVEDMLREKDYGYFMSQGLGELLGRAGLGGDQATMRALVRRLIDDGSPWLLAPISAGLRDSAGDDDEFARMAADMANQARHDAFCGPLVDALVDIGKRMPAAAVGIAARMIRLGCADFGAFLLGGAYGGARTECDEAIERLSQSMDPVDAAAAVRSLRVASAEHGSPCPEHVRNAVRHAMAHAMSHKSALIQNESMAAMLEAYAKGDAEAGWMIKSLAAGFRACRTPLASRIFADSPFDDEQSLRHLETCVGGDNPDWGSVHCAYRALVGIARGEPRGATRLLFRMLNTGRYDEAMAGVVLEELGRSDPLPATDAVLELLRGRDRSALDGQLEQIMRRLLRFADCEEVAARVFRTLDERPGALGACLSVLCLLVIESDRDGRDPGFAASVMSRLLERVDGVGACATAVPGGTAATEPEPSMRRKAAAGTAANPGTAPPRSQISPPPLAAQGRGSRRSRGAP